MARKKKRTYGDMAREAAGIEAEMAEERARMAGIMAGALASGGAAVKLGDCSDGDLRRVMVMVAKDIDLYLDRLAAEKQAHRDAQKKGGAARKKRSGESVDRTVAEDAREEVHEEVPDGTRDDAVPESAPAGRDIFSAYGSVQSDKLEIPGLESFGASMKGGSRTGRE